MRLGDLVVRFVADLGGWSGGVKQAQEDMDKAGKSAEDMGTSAKTSAGDLLVLAGSAAAAGYASYQAVQRYGGMAQQLKDLSYQTGISTEKLQKLQYAAILSGTDFGKVSFGLNQLSLAIANAGDTSSESFKSFMSIGIDPRGQSVDKIFESTAEALSEMDDETERNRVAFALYGRSWKELLPYMEEYIKNADKIKDHPVISEEDQKVLRESKTAMDELTNSYDMFVATVIAKAASVQNAYNSMFGKEAFDNIKDWADYFNTQRGTGGGGAGGRAGPEKLPPDIAEPRTTPLSDPYANMPVKQAEQKYLNEVTIPKLKDELTVLQSTGTEEEVAAKSIEYHQALEQSLQNDIDLTKDLTDAQEEYLGVLQDIKNLENRDKTTTREYLMDVQAAGRNMGQIRSLSLGYNKEMLRSADTKRELGGELKDAGTTVLAAGGNTSSESVTITVGPNTISKDVDIDTLIKKIETDLNVKRQQQGVRS